MPSPDLFKAFGQQSPLLQASRRGRTKEVESPIWPVFSCSWRTCNATQCSRGLHQSAVSLSRLPGRCHITVNRLPYGRPVGEDSEMRHDGTETVEVHPSGTGRPAAKLGVFVRFHLSSPRSTHPSGGAVIIDTGRSLDNFVIPAALQRRGPHRVKVEGVV
jgi:hypothetical protein